MPSRKKLQVVAHNVVESFLSQLNYGYHDYAIGHIIKAAWETGATNLQVDLLSGKTNQSGLLVEPIVQSLQWYVKDFHDLVRRTQSDFEFIKSAEFEITVDPTNKRLHRDADYFESPFTASVRIVDDRNVTHAYSKSDWGYPWIRSVNTLQKVTGLKNRVLTLKITGAILVVMGVGLFWVGKSAVAGILMIGFGVITFVRSFDKIG